MGSSAHLQQLGTRHFRLAATSRSAASPQHPEWTFAGDTAGVGNDTDSLLSARLVLSAWDVADRRDTGLGVDILMLPDYKRVRAAARLVAKAGIYRLKLGIMADSPLSAMRALEAWTEGLQLPGRWLTSADVSAVDSEHQPTDAFELVGRPVYL